jgi:hypothetical protein
MQIVFDPGCSPQEYVAQGLVEPQRPRVCPRCRIGKPHKHGFYKRFFLDGFKLRRILIRRYYCRRCGTATSFLPSFCVPKFQYSLHLLWEVLHLRLEKGLTLKRCIERLLSRFPRLHWLPQRISFYAKRFLANLPWIESMLRGIFPNMKLDLDAKKRAKKVLVTVRTGFDQIQSPARLFHEQCHRSFLAPLR